MNEINLRNKVFPRSGEYDEKCVIENEMGLNSLWLTEWCMKNIEVKPDCKLLDLGCGRGLSSVFLAREYGVSLIAADLWTKPEVILENARKFNLEDSILPVNIDANQLPFAENYFDLIVCMDAYIYFGTNDLYTKYISKYLKPGGRLVISVPGFMNDIGQELPEHLEPFWADECWTWHTLEWWKFHLTKMKIFSLIEAETLENGIDHWLQWKRVRLTYDPDNKFIQSDISVMENDGGRYMGFIKLVAEKNHF